MLPFRTTFATFQLYSSCLTSSSFFELSTTAWMFFKVITYAKTTFMETVIPISWLIMNLLSYTYWWMHTWSVICNYGNPDWISFNRHHPSCKVIIKALGFKWCTFQNGDYYFKVNCTRQHELLQYDLLNEISLFTWLVNEDFDEGLPTFPFK